jgi:hypothetical protein
MTFFLKSLTVWKTIVKIRHRNKEEIEKELTFSSGKIP